METSVADIAPDIYRLSTYIPEADFMFNQFLIDAEEPLIFHTGLRSLFPLVSSAVGKIAPLNGFGGSLSVTWRPMSAAR